MEFFKKYWYVALIIVIGAAVYIGVKKGLINMFNFKSEAEQNAEDEINRLDYDGDKLTINDSQAILISQQLLAAMDRLGTDESTIVSLLQNLTRDDLLFVIKIFGIKQYNGVGESIGLDKFIYSQNLNLIGWLKAELSGKALQTVSEMFNRYNIPFREK